jgi:hypothetical protein
VRERDKGKEEGEEGKGEEEKGEEEEEEGEEGKGEEEEEGTAGRTHGENYDQWSG